MEWQRVVYAQSRRVGYITPEQAATPVRAHDALYVERGMRWVGPNGIRHAYAYYEGPST